MMDVRWRYRVMSFVGAVVLTIAAVTFANYPAVQRVLVVALVVGELPTRVLTGRQFLLGVATTLSVTVVALAPLFKPQPRRILDVVSLTVKRVVLATLTLAAIGYFDYTYRLPRLTLIATAAILLAVLPVMFVLIRRRPASGSRGVVVGMDRETIAELVAVSDVPLLGYVAPPFASDAPVESRDHDPKGTHLTDGGETEIEGESETGTGTGAGTRTGKSPEGEGQSEPDPLSELGWLGGLSRLEEILVSNDVDTALLAFDGTDREEFFGTLDTCYRHGVDAKIHRDYADSVLVSDLAEGPLVDVDLEPWDWQDHVVKRTFDVVFAATGLLVLSPVVLLISVLIKLDSPGPVLYSQHRTAEFGERFTIYKFRSMVPEAEAETGPKLSDDDRGEQDPRVTRIGHILRESHLDEIPQLWSILIGDMSVVGPRPERPELDADMETEVGSWRRRWFVRPGLTGLAQIRGMTGYDPRQKLRYDVEYIRKQSFWFDLKIVLRQIWLVLADVRSLLNDSINS